LRTRFNDYGKCFRDRVAPGAFIAPADYIAATQYRHELQEKLARVMTDVDLLILPTTPGPAPLIKDVGSYGLFEIPNFTMPFNVAGTPALAICNGYTASGLPLSMQIVGRPFEDAAVLRAGHAYEKATPWKDHRPALVSA